MKKDGIKRILVSIVFGLFIAYLVYLLVGSKHIVKNEYLEYNTLLTTILILLSLYITVFYGVYPIKVKFSRSTLFVIGLAALMMGKLILENDPLTGIYIGDLASVLGVATLILGPTNLMVTDKIKKQVNEKDIEIIEV